MGLLRSPAQGKPAHYKVQLSSYCKVANNPLVRGLLRNKLTTSCHRRHNLCGEQACPAPECEALPNGSPCCIRYIGGAPNGAAAQPSAGQACSLQNTAQPYSTVANNAVVRGLLRISSQPPAHGRHNPCGEQACPATECEALPNGSPCCTRYIGGAPNGAASQPSAGQACSLQNTAQPHSTVANNAVVRGLLRNKLTTSGPRAPRPLW